MYYSIHFRHFSWKKSYSDVYCLLLFFIKKPYSIWKDLQFTYIFAPSFIHLLHKWIDFFFQEIERANTEHRNWFYYFVFNSFIVHSLTRNDNAFQTRKLKTTNSQPTFDSEYEILWKMKTGNKKEHTFIPKIN